MYTLDAKTNTPPKSIPASQMKRGDLAVLLAGNGEFLGHILLRTYDRLISLTSPQTGSWVNPENIHTLSVRLLEKGEEVVLTSC